MTQAAFPKPIGQMPTLTFCLLDQLEIDEAYQRSIENSSSQAMIRAIAKGWNWDLCQPLFVARRDDGRMFVVDGQHRLAAARMRGDIDQLPCIVSFTNGVAQEAKLFSEFNRRRRPPSAIDLYFSDLTAGDPVAADIQLALDAAGLKMAKHANNAAFKPGEICNVGGLRRAHQMHGPAVMSFALLMMARAWPEQRLQYAGTIFPGIAEVCGAERSLVRNASWTGTPRAQSISGFLARKAQIDWYGMIQRFKGENPGTKMSAAAEQVMLAQWKKANAA